MEPIFRSPKITENTLISKLSPMQIVNFIISQASNKEVVELEAQRAVIIDKNMRMGKLVNTISRAVEPIKDGSHEFVLLKIHKSLYNIFMDYVSSPTSELQYYNVDVRRNKEKAVETFFYVKISRKARGNDVEKK